MNLGGSVGNNIGSIQSNATAKNGLTNSSSGVSVSGTTSTNGNHRHTIDLWASGANIGHPATTALADIADDYTSYAGDHNHTVNSTGTASAQGISGDNETRPVNAYLSYIIKI